MKNLAGFIFGFFLLLLASCADDFEVQTTAEGGKMTFQMGVQTPDLESVATRAFCEKPAMETLPLWVVVFDESGYLVEYAKATNQTLADDVVKFEVTLQATSEKRILHFLLGYSDDLLLAFGHESTVIGGLTVSLGKDGHDVYWQRKELDGISTETVAANLQKVPLIRNFAKITVKNNKPEKFDLQGYYVVHQATSGTVAPYANGKFVDYIAADKLKSYEGLVNGKMADNQYAGFMPDDVTFVPFPKTESELVWTGPSLSTYLYEHSLTDNPDEALSVLLKGNFIDDKSNHILGYYKVDLVNYDGHGRITNYHVLRNFHYEININEVIGPGRATAEEAYSKPAHNNLSTSILTKNLLSISDGTSALYVSYTDTVLTYSIADAENAKAEGKKVITLPAVKLKYMFVPDLKSPNETGNARVMFGLKDGKFGSFLDAKQIQNTVVEGEWSTLTLTPVFSTKLAKQTITQKLVLYDKGDANKNIPSTGLSREVKYELRLKLPMAVECSPKLVSSDIGSEVKVNIKLPRLLNKNLFPMTFQIEAQDKSRPGYVDEKNPGYLMQYISPKDNDEKIFSVLGNSLVPGFENTRSFHYERELTYEAFKKLSADPADGSKCVFPCSFATNKNFCASTVYVQNKYFDSANDYFDNYTVNFAGGEHVYGENQQVLLSIATTIAGTFSFDFPNGALVLEEQPNVNVTNKTIQVEQPGTYTVKTHTQKGIWNEDLKVNLQINPEDHADSYVSTNISPTAERNLLFVQAKIDPNTSYQPQDGMIVYLCNGDNNEELAAKTWSEWNSGVYVYWPGLTANTWLTCYFKYFNDNGYRRGTNYIENVAGNLNGYTLWLTFEPK